MFSLYSNDRYPFLFNRLAGFTASARREFSDLEFDFLTGQIKDIPTCICCFSVSIKPFGITNEDLFKLDNLTGGVTFL